MQIVLRRWMVSYGLITLVIVYVIFLLENYASFQGNNSSVGTRKIVLVLTGNLENRLFAICHFVALTMNNNGSKVVYWKPDVSVGSATLENFFVTETKLFVSAVEYPNVERLQPFTPESCQSDSVPFWFSEASNASIFRSIFVQNPRESCNIIHSLKHFTACSFETNVNECYRNLQPSKAVLNILKGQELSQFKNRHGIYLGRENEQSRFLLENGNCDIISKYSVTESKKPEVRGKLCKTSLFESHPELLSNMTMRKIVEKVLKNPKANFVIGGRQGKVIQAVVESIHREKAPFQLKFQFPLQKVSKNYV